MSYRILGAETLKPISPQVIVEKTKNNIIDFKGMYSGDFIIFLYRITVLMYGELSMHWIMY